MPLLVGFLAVVTPRVADGSFELLPHRGDCFEANPLLFMVIFYFLVAPMLYSSMASCHSQVEVSRTRQVPLV